MQRSNAGNWLYRNPALYDQVYGQSAHHISDLVRHKILDEYPTREYSILDVGCGTGRLLAELGNDACRSVGVDLNPKMIEYATQKFPESVFHVGDMRCIDETDEFDVIVCVGSVIMYALTNSDLLQTLVAIRRQLKPRGRLMLGFWNASELIGQTLNLPKSFKIHTESMTAEGVASYKIDHANQTLQRKRTWNLSDGRVMEDWCEYRLIFSQEIEFFLDQAGLCVVEKVTDESNEFLAGRLYVIAAHNQ